MDEYIERKAAIRAVLNNSTEQVGYSREDATDCIRYMDATDVAPVRHGHCPYCDAKTNDFIPINHTVEYSGIEIALNRKGMLRVRVYESGQETFTAQDIVEIKCCPNCGAKMDADADNEC